jgi:hypothetical protein
LEYCINLLISCLPNPSAGGQDTTGYACEGMRTRPQAAGGAWNRQYHELRPWVSTCRLMQQKGLAQMRHSRGASK